MLMKNFTYVLVAALLSTSAAFAQSPLTQERSQRVRNAQLMTAKENPATKLVARSMDRSNAVMQKASCKVTLPTFPTDDPVTEAPEGTPLKDGYRKGYAFYNSYFGVMGTEVDGAVGSYVEAPDGTLWLANTISKLTGSGYLRLDKVSDGNYVAKTPQTIYGESGTNYYATRLVLTEDGEYLTYALDSLDEKTCDTDVPFTFKDGTLKQVNADVDEDYGYPRELIALTNNEGAWYGYGDAQIEVAPNTETPVTFPTTLTPKDYVLSTRSLSSDGTVAQNNQIVQVAVDGNDFYLHDPYHTELDMWAKGTAEGNKVQFLTQYLGADEASGNHVWFMPTTYSDEYWEDYDYHYSSSTAATSLDLTYDADADRYTAADSTGFAINGKPSELYAFDTYSQPVLTPFNEVAATPADPSFEEYMAYDESYGYGGFAVTVPTTDADGNFLNPNKLYYNVFFDGSEDPETFSPDDYVYLTEEMTDVPSSFADSWDFYVSGDLHTIYFYSDAETVGVQSTYTGGGETHSSNLVWYDPTGIKGLATSSNKADVKSVTYFDLQGRRLSTPTHGINLKVTTYADGSKQAEKVLK